MNKNKPLLVTRPTLGSLDKLLPYLEDIWSRRVVTNAGPYHDQFEQALAEFLGVEHLSLVSNATLGLILALKSLDLSGEVITTPLSFVATTNSLHWAGLTPVFVDIDPETLNLDPQKVGRAISPDTAAILPVHLFGRVCDLDAFNVLSRENDIRVIYDAAQAFGLSMNGKTIFGFGDSSVVSFHAAKVFNSIEGGAIVSRNAETKKRIDAMRNNGIGDGKDSCDIGLNAKMCEIHSAIGCANLPGIGRSIEALGAREMIYRSALEDIVGIDLVDYPSGQSRNHNYFPIIINESFGPSRDDLWHWLEENEILAKRYFYPLISSLPAYKHLPSASAENLPVATRIAKSILCLPIYPDLEISEIYRIVELIQRCRSTYRY